MESQKLNDVLDGLRRRQRFLNAVTWGVYGLFAASVTVLVAGIALAVAGFETDSARPWLLLAAIPVCGLLGTVAGVFRPIDRLHLARVLDRAASSQDRFASALQLTGHHRHERVELVLADALEHTRHIEPAQALPFAWPKVGKWFPGAVVLFALVVGLAPNRESSAAIALEPEVSPEQWSELEEKFNQELKRNFKEPKRDVEKELHERLKQLGSSLAQKPEKKEVLASIAKMRSDIEQRRRNLKTGNLNMKHAASALQSSEMLKKLAEMLKQGDYSKASDELKKLAEELRLAKTNPTASELEAMAKDFERLARELSESEELHKKCEQCASAAKSLNQQELADALQRLSKQLDENKNDLEECDSLCKANTSLDDLEQMLSQMKMNKSTCSLCQGKNSGSCPMCSGKKGMQGFVHSQSAKKGGLKAGVGTAKDWTGGGLTEESHKTESAGIPDQERGGKQSTVSKTISADERAESALAFKDKYVQLVQQAEAELAMEDIPFTYRDFLRRYFSSIKPQDSKQQPEPAADKPAE